MNYLLLSFTIAFGILSLPTLFFIGDWICYYVKEFTMHYVYKFDLFGAREKWLKNHPNWDKPYTGNSMLAGFINQCFKQKRPW